MPYKEIEVWSQHIDRAKKAKTWLPSITKECNTQIARLEEAGGKFNLQKVEKIRKALAYVTQAIDLQQAWCVTEFDIIPQEQGGPDIGNIIYCDFSNFDKVMNYKYSTYSFKERPATRDDQAIYETFGDRDPSGEYTQETVLMGYNDDIKTIIYDKKNPVLHCSLQDALNLSPSNLFNFGLFGGNGSYGTMWGKTKELAEVEKNAKSAMSI
jgi:hypothetical protein